MNTDAKREEDLLESKQKRKITEMDEPETLEITTPNNIVE